MPMAWATPPATESVRRIASQRAAVEASDPRMAASFTPRVWSRHGRRSRGVPTRLAWLEKSERLVHTRPTARVEPLRRAARLAAAERYRASRRSRASVRALAAAREPLDLDRDAGDHAVVGGRAGEADGDGNQQLEVLAGLPDELGDRIVGRLARRRLARPLEGEEPLAPWIEERDVVFELVLRLRPPTDPAPPPGEAQLAVHAAEPSAQREGRLEEDVAGAERLPPGAGWKTEGEPDVERERAGAEVEEGVAEPELEILEAVHRGLARGIAHAIGEPDDRLHTVGDAVLDLRPHGRAPLVRKAEVTRRNRGLELVLVLDVDRAGERELLRDDRHPLRATRRRREQQRDAGDASCDRGRPRGDHRAAGTVLRRGQMPALTTLPPGPSPPPRSGRRRRSAWGRASESRPTAPSAGPRPARRRSARRRRSRGHAAPPAHGPCG